MSSQVELPHINCIASRSQKGREANSREIEEESESHTQYLSSLSVHHTGSAEAQSTLLFLGPFNVSDISKPLRQTHSVHSITSASSKLLLTAEL